MMPTLGVGLGRTGAGPTRTRHVFESSQCLQGWESGSSPHLGHSVFAGQGPFGPLTVHKSSFMGHFGGLFRWRPLPWPAAPFLRFGGDSGLVSSP